MVRMSKQSERRNRSPHKRRAPAEKTGPRKERGLQPHVNALEGEMATKAFIPKIK